MYKALLVDDDGTERHGLAALSVFPRCAVQIVAEASNGREALELAEKLKPDIVISDVRMPVMDGLVFTAQLKKRYPQTHIIMMSGFEDFNAAQQALAIGADAYLTKPLSPQDLEQTLVRVTGHINVDAEAAYEAERLHTRMANMRPVVRERLLRDLLLGVRSYDKDVRREAKEVGLFEHAGKLAVLLIKAEAAAGNRAQTPPLLLEMQDVLAGMLRALTLSEPVAVYNDLYAAIAYLPRRMNDETAFDHLQQCAAYMLTRMREQSEVDITIAVSAVMDDESDLGLMYNQALHTLTLHTFYGVNRVYWYDSDEPEQTKPDIAVSARAIHRYLGEDNTEAARAAIAAFFDTVRAANPPVEQVQAMVCELITYWLVLSAGAEIGLSNLPGRVEWPASLPGQAEWPTGLPGQTVWPTDLQERNESFFARIITTKRIDDLQDYVIPLLTRRGPTDVQHRQRIENMQSRGEHLAQQAVALIRQHYTEDISAETIAQQLFITPSHLRRLFKNVTGQTVQECVLAYRMARAQELLRTADTKVAEISQAVGYDNPSYFNIVFKKYFGVTPGEYRHDNTII